jgi:hypothetical protein
MPTTCQLFVGMTIPTMCHVELLFAIGWPRSLGFCEHDFEFFSRVEFFVLEIGPIITQGILEHGQHNGTSPTAQQHLLDHHPEVSMLCFRAVGGIFVESGGRNFQLRLQDEPDGAMVRIDDTIRGWKNRVSTYKLHADSSRSKKRIQDSFYKHTVQRFNLRWLKLSTSPTTTEQVQS